MKHWLNILLVTLVAAALMQLYRAQVELECTCDVLAFQAKCQSDMLKGTTRHFCERTRQDAHKIAELEAQLKALNAAKTQSMGNGSATAALF